MNLDGTGITNVEYAVIASDSFPSQAESNWNNWSAMTKNGTWSSNVKNGTTWTGNIPVVHGKNWIQIRATDAAGNKTLLTTPLITNVDLISPNLAEDTETEKAIQVTNLVEGIKLVNGKTEFDVGIKTKDDVLETNCGVTSVKLKIGNQDFSTGTINATGSGNDWTATIPIGSQTTSGSVYVQITDAVGNSTIRSAFQLQVDGSNPTVSFTTPISDNINVNKNITISGIASDNQTLSSVILSYLSAGTYSENGGSYSFSSDQWTDIPVNGIYSWNTTNFDTVGKPDGNSTTTMQVY